MVALAPQLDGFGVGGGRAASSQSPPFHRGQVTGGLIPEPCISGTRQYRIWYLHDLSHRPPPTTSVPSRRWMTLGHRRPRPADGGARRHRREHRPPVCPGRPRLHATASGSGSSPPTRSPSAACCCSAAGCRTCGAQAHLHHRSHRIRVASALGGAADTFELLVGARALQGAFGALLAPTALAVLTTTFTIPKERARAFGVFGAIAGAGGAIGLLLGGVLTETLHWRWNLYINVVIAAVALVGALAVHPVHRPHRPAAEARHPRHPAGLGRSVRPGLRLLERRDRRLGLSPDVGDARRRRDPARSRSSSGRRAPRIRCCRWRSCSTATAEPPTCSVLVAGAGMFGDLPVRHLLPADHAAATRRSRPGWRSCR